MIYDFKDKIYYLYIRIKLRLSLIIFNNSQLIVLSSILIVQPIINYEDIIFASVQEPIVESKSSVYYSMLCHVGNATYNGVSSAINTVTHATVVGISLIATIAAIKDPKEFLINTGKLTVSTFKTGSQMLTANETITFTTALVMITAVGVFGICAGVGHKLYEKYISTLVTPLSTPKSIDVPLPEIIQNIELADSLHDLKYVLGFISMLLLIIYLSLIIYIIRLEWDNLSNRFNRNIVPEA